MEAEQRAREEIDQEVRDYMKKWDGQFRDLKLEKFIKNPKGDFYVRYTFAWDWGRKPARMFTCFHSFRLTTEESDPRSNVIYNVEVWC